jgi:membrane protein YdbS with pleckstrin-like domain
VWIADQRVLEIPPVSHKEREWLMAIILLVLLLALLLGGLGFAVHVLWWIALIVLVIWLLGFILRVGESGSRGRWYRW